MVVRPVWLSDRTLHSTQPVRLSDRFAARAKWSPAPVRTAGGEPVRLSDRFFLGAAAGVARLGSHLFIRGDRALVLGPQGLRAFSAAVVSALQSVGFRCMPNTRATGSFSRLATSTDSSTCCTLKNAPSGWGCTRSDV